MDRKANIMDVQTFFVGAIIFGISILMLSVIFINFGTVMQSSGLFSNATEFTNILISYPTYFDWIIPTIYIVSMIFSVISARLIPSNYGYLVLSMIIYIILAMVLMVIGNIFNAFFTHAAFSDAANQMTLTGLVLNNSLPLGIIYMIITFIALYAGKDE